jgi:hypothetical protein
MDVPLMALMALAEGACQGGSQLHGLRAPGLTHDVGGGGSLRKQAEERAMRAALDALLGLCKPSRAPPSYSHGATISATSARAYAGAPSWRTARRTSSARYCSARLYRAEHRYCEPRWCQPGRC